LPLSGPRSTTSSTRTADATDFLVAEFRPPVRAAKGGVIAAGVDGQGAEGFSRAGVNDADVVAVDVQDGVGSSAVNVWRRAVKPRGPRPDAAMTRLVYGVGVHTPRPCWSRRCANPHRLRNDAAFAHLCGVAPSPASSGKTNRYRLNPGGNRQAKHALWRIVFTRMSSDERTRKYVARRLAEGKTERYIIRYVAREIYTHLVTC
jgi:hypothetical protein